MGIQPLVLGAALALASPTWASQEGGALQREEPIQPLPRTVEIDPARAALGKRLFHEPRLSGDATISCASCHPIDRGGADGMARSIGVGGQIGVINAPTVLNSGFNAFQFWDGRAATLEEQIDGPITDPREMASSWRRVIAVLEGDAGYRDAFALAFGDGITIANVKRAIADFERTLITPDSPFDRHLRGEPEAIGDQAREGYRLFKAYGCSACHQGRLVGGNMFEKMGVIIDYFSQRGEITEADYGRYNVTGQEEHRFEFKVPSLRNVALTAPYFHDASAATLEDAVRAMGYFQLGRTLPEEDVRRIVLFLESLTGEPPG